MRVLVVGQVVVDEIVVDESRALDKQEPATVRFGGKGYNIAHALARLGASVSFLSAVGHDDAGIDIKAQMRMAGIGSELIVHATKGGRVAVGTPRIRLNEGLKGERDVVEMTAPQMEDYYAAALSRPTPEQLNAFDAVVYTLEFGEQLHSKTADLVRRLPSSVLRVAHPAPRPRTDRPRLEVAEVLGGADVVVPNRFEARFLVDQPTLAPSDLARRLAAIYRCGMAAVTLGRDGWAWCEAATAGAGQVPAVRAVEKVGASDVFTAALTWARFAGLRAPDACYVAGVAAAIAVGRSGGVERFPTKEEVIGSTIKLKEFSSDVIAAL